MGVDLEERIRLLENGSYWRWIQGAGGGEREGERDEQASAGQSAEDGGLEIRAL